MGLLRVLLGALQASQHARNLSVLCCCQFSPGRFRRTQEAGLDGGTEASLQWGLFLFLVAVSSPPPLPGSEKRKASLIIHVYVRKNVRPPIKTVDKTPLCWPCLHVSGHV